MPWTMFRYITSNSAGTPRNSVGFTSAMRSRMRRRSFSNVISPPTLGAATMLTMNGNAWCIGSTITMRSRSLNGMSADPPAGSP